MIKNEHLVCIIKVWKECTIWKMKVEEIQSFV